MTLDFLLLGGGLALLLLAGDALVRGAVNLSLRLGIPALIVSLTVVAFGTSAPELLISVQAVLDDVPGIALGNVVGSNIANILLVLGVPALLTGLATDKSDTRRNFLMMMGASLLFLGLCLVGPLTWWHGLVLLAGLALMLGDAVRSARAHRAEQNTATAEDAEDAEEAPEGADPEASTLRIALFLVAGLIGLPLGANLMIDGAVNIARTFGVSETAIGLTLVAVGTSLPELATTVMAAIRRQADVALGNVIGSNMFNLLAIIGVAAIVGPIPVPPEILRFDMPVMIVTSLLLLPFVYRGWPISRTWGVALLAGYGAYAALVLT